MSGARRTVEGKTETEIMRCLKRQRDPAESRSDQPDHASQGLRHSAGDTPVQPHALRVPPGAAQCLKPARRLGGHPRVDAAEQLRIAGSPLRHRLRHHVPHDRPGISEHQRAGQDRLLDGREDLPQLPRRVARAEPPGPPAPPRRPHPGRQLKGYTQINSTPLASPGTVASLFSLQGAHEIRVRPPRQFPC